MARREVLPGVHLVAAPYVNFYLVEGEGGVTAIDAGLPSDFALLTEALREIGGELRATVVTHAHADHIGVADRARRELGATVWVPEGDAALARRPTLGFRSERLPLGYLARYPATRSLYAGLSRSGGLRVDPLRDVRTYAPGETLDVPGAPVAVATPGHTAGHSSLHLGERDVLFAGDALVTLDPYTGLTGPRQVARAATLDSTQGRASLDAIEATGAQTLLGGHGPPWLGGVDRAVSLARVAEVA